jgi:hypothetical protein
VWLWGVMEVVLVAGVSGVEEEEETAVNEDDDVDDKKDGAGDAIVSLMSTNLVPAVAVSDEGFCSTNR